MIDDLDHTFMVSNGDLLTSMDLAAMGRQHLGTQANSLSGVDAVADNDVWAVGWAWNNRLSAYREKPTTMYFVSMGVYILQREAVRPHITKGEYLDMPSLLLAMRLGNHDVRCFHDDCMWLDIGRPEDFALAQSMFEQNRALFLK